MLRACFVGSLSPKWAENILIKRNRGSYLVRQSDLDPDQLLLSYVSEKGIKHVIVPEFEDSIYFSKLNKLKNKLDDESVDVQKFLNSFGCKDPVSPFMEAQPSSFKKKSRLEDGALHRCSVCSYENEDMKKAQQHRNRHRASLCSKCDGYVLQVGLSYHEKKCTDVQLHKCNHEKGCDYTSPHQWMVQRHVREVHCKPQPCLECGKSFKTQVQLENHMKIHQPNQKEQCKFCDKSFNTKRTKYRHIHEVHLNPTVKSSIGFMRLAGQSLRHQYKERGRKFHFCSDCPFKSTNKTHFQNHQRIHLKAARKIRPDRYTCVTTCTYQNKWRYKVKDHMKTCRRYLLTTDHYRPKGTLTNEKVCLLSSKVDISNRKMMMIMKEVEDCVGSELMDYNLRGALSQNLNSTSEFYYSKEIKFTKYTKENKEGEERTTSFVCLKDLKAMIEEIMKRRGVTRVLVVISMDGGQDKLLATLAVFDLDTLDELTDTGFSVGGRKQIFLVACAANVPENRTMVKFFFKEMRVKTLDMPFILIGDEKMKNLMFGKLRYFESF